ncbi:VWA domain-containing protein [Cytobacillus kochii]|uniref:VWA domain-containing protein n=1 Tax=Cytobacillus kochii TaxID=859143 RepID=UPI00402AB1E5
MFKRLRLLLISILALFFFAACNNDQPVDDSSKPEEEEVTESVSNQEEQNKESEGKEIADLIEELPEPADSIEDLVNAEVGSFTGKDYDDLTKEEQETVIAELKTLPKVEEGYTEEELELYWRKSLSLFHEDYPNPAEALDQMSMEAFGSPEIEDERYQFKDQLNVEILLDASGSMANVIDGKSMMDIAKESIAEFAKNLPEEANIALRVYGHEGSGSDADKSLSCKSNELVYDMGSYNEGKLSDAMDKFNPAGWTPLAKAIEEAEKDLSKLGGENNTNIIYLVSDGVETCDGDPSQAAKNLAGSGIQPIVNVIGFDVNADGQKQLKEVAKAAEGIYSNARNQSELNTELDRAKEIAEKWEAWKTDSLKQASDVKFQQLLSDIPLFNIDWSNANNFEKFNMRKPLRVLRDDGHISRELYQALSDRTSERFSWVMDMQDVVRKDLREIANESYEEIETQINEKYNNNVE